MRRLEGKVAVITGAARGLGKQMALQFAGEGADIVIDDIREEEMEVTAQEIKKSGQKMIVVMADISTKEGAKKLIDSAIDNFKRVDILVNNAGVPSRGSLLETTSDEWDEAHNVDLRGVFLCTQAVAQYMIEQKYGKIINISSVHGMGTASGPLVYSAAKAGVIQLTKTCARELGPYGINVNCIAPGRVVTEMTYINRTPEDVERSIESRKKASVLHRVGTPEDIANLAVFLASGESSFISAQTIACDGGRMDKM
ncbi:SDR family NAD(P)-dependent oxidoreductase [Chloroflexota bacterium]